MVTLSHEAVEHDRLILDVLPGDTFLLCSDGLARYLEGAGELTSYLRRENIESVPQELVDLANSRGGRDDITVVAVRAEATELEQEKAAHVESFAKAKLDAIQWVPLFEGLSLANRMRVANAGDVRICGLAETVADEGDFVSQMCIVLQGGFAVLKGGKTVGCLRAGDSIGEETLFAARPWPRGVRSLEDGQVLVISGARFRELVRRRPWLGVELLLNLGRSRS